MIGIRFVKTYYQVLSTTPAQIFKFYKPSSVLSHGEGSTPTSAVDFEKYDLKVRWGEAQRFDFDNGAIDAQPSSDGSILLVVTGHVVVKTEDGKEERKGFVHTFFLALVSLPNKQKTYYVKNDILRFLKPDVPSVADNATPTAPSPEPVVAVTSEPAKEEPEPVEAPAVVEEDLVKEEKKEDEPEPEVVEEKTEPPKEEPKVEEEPAPAVEKPKEKKEEPAKETTPEPKKKEGKGKRQRGRGKSPQNAAKQQPASKLAPGSWASLVASGSGPSANPGPQASTPSKPPAPEKKTETPAKSAPTKKEDKPDAPSTKENEKSNKDKPKRDPDNTLVIKNLPDGTKEPELLAIFEQFAVQTNAKIVSSTISNHRGLAFVDYDSVAPVMAAVEQHGKEPIQLNGKVLEVDQKTAEQRARKARGGYRSGSPNQNNNNRGGGRQNKRNNGGRGGKGNRGGGGGNNNGGNKDGGGGGR